MIEAAGLDAEYVWAAGSAATTIVDAARDNGADLIVLGEHHHSFLGRVFGSDVGAEVERRAGGARVDLGPVALLGHRRERHERVQLVVARLDHAVGRFGHLVPDAGQIAERLGDDEP